MSSDGAAPEAGRGHPGSATVLLLAGTMFAAVLALRWRSGAPADATALLFTIPIALLAVTLGARAGLLAGLLGIALLGTWVAHAQVHLSPLGWAARVSPMLVSGVLLGVVAERLRHADAERRRLATAARRHREAIELNDTIVQGLTAAKWALEAGNAHRALDVVSDTLELGHQRVSDLIRDAELSPSWTGRPAPDARG